MHDLKAIYTKVKVTIGTHCKEYFEFGENIQLYPRQPKMSDMEVISLSIVAECLQVDSENLLWSKLKLIIKISLWNYLTEPNLIKDERD